MQYTLSYETPSKHFIHVEFVLEKPDAENQLLRLPFWRPGRYEKGSFAKNIQEFHIFNEAGEKLAFQKTDSHSWNVETKGAASIRVTYTFYASDLNAGSTYVDKGLLYVNPVNLCLYAADREMEACTLKLNIEPQLEVYGALPEQANGFYQFTDFHHLADTPFFCSADVKTEQYEVAGVTHNLHFLGYYKGDMAKVLHDFKKFTTFIHDRFGAFPYTEYHFLFFGFPQRFYHGVEHLSSTVIALGPGHSILTENYNEFLSISCHELYHAWNVKSIRPADWWPYRYNEESYSRMGYLAEGVTTYMGELLLYQSGVWNFKTFVTEIEKFLDRHFNNFGRLNLSVAESSYDTWLDGYERGIPNRKVSIYNEGALIAFFADCIIREESGGKHSIHDAMHTLYHDFYKKDRGVSETEYWQVLEQFGGKRIAALYEAHVDGTEDYHSPLDTAFEHLGLQYEIKPSEDFHEAHLGMRMLQKGSRTWEIVGIYPGSPAELAGIYVGDMLVMVNDIPAKEDIAQWFGYFKDESMDLLVERNEAIHHISIKAEDRTFYKRYVVKPLAKPSEQQVKAFKSFSYQ